MILVYGKPDCKKCNSFKEKMAMMGMVEGRDWEGYDCTNLQDEWERGMQIAATHAMSALQMIGGDMPAVDIDGRVYRYAEAIKLLKEMAK